MYKFVSKEQLKKVMRNDWPGEKKENECYICKDPVNKFFYICDECDSIQIKMYKPLHWRVKKNYKEGGEKDE